MTFPQAPLVSPYRQPQNLARLIAPDRRWLYATLLGASCFVAGVTVTLTGSDVAEAATEAVSDATDIGSALHKPRTFEHATPSTLMRPAEPAPERVLVLPRAGSVSDKARDALLSNDPALAKALLLPVVARGAGTDYDRRMLKAACDGLKDRACLDFLKGA
jgi:hypothetical protein